MGSVQIQDAPCLRCQYPYGFRDFYYKSQEEYFTCPQCGYSRRILLLRDRKKEKQDPEMICYKMTKDGKYMMRIYRTFAKGAYSFSEKSGHIAFGPLTKLPTERQIQTFKNLLKDKDATGYTTIFDDETKTVKVVAGEFYPLYGPEKNEWEHSPFNSPKTETGDE